MPAVVVLLATGILLGPCATPAASQNTTATITGLVLDDQKLPVPGAALVIQDDARGLKRTTTSARDGSFEIAGLPPGEFVLKATFQGFAATQLALRLEVNQRLRADILLRPSGVAEDVVVHQTAPLLDTVSTSVGEVIGEQQLSQLPLNGRQFLELALTGARRAHVARRVDGVHSSPLLAAGAELGDQRLWRTPECQCVPDRRHDEYRPFVQHLHRQSAGCHPEFQIETSSYSAELGAAGTGQINVVTKSGTQSLHGSLYDHFRNSAFDARLFTSPDKLPHFDQNQYGVCLGTVLRGAHVFLRQFRGPAQHPGPVDGDERTARDVADGRLQRRSTNL